MDLLIALLIVAVYGVAFWMLVIWVDAVIASLTGTGLLDRIRDIFNKK